MDVFDREGPWTEEAYLALPADGRVELVDGTLLVGPATTPARERAVQAVREALNASLPEGLRVVGPVPIRLGPDCVLVPDLLVTRAEQDEPEPEAEQEPEPEAKKPDAAEDAGSVAEEQEPEPSEPRILEAADALLVAEFVGREHGAADRTFKPQIYARSRIPYSLLIDYDSPFALANMIIGGRYHEYAYAEGAERFWLDEPFHLEMDLTSLTAEKAQETVAQETDAQETVAQETDAQEKAEKKAVPAP